MKIIESLTPGIRKYSKIFLCTFILVHVLMISKTNAQTISTSGNITVGAGAVVNSNFDMSLQGGGTLKVMGTLILKNNLVNQKTAPDSLGSGTIELSGTTSQTVSGPNVFANLKIDNAAGVSLTGYRDNQVYGVLTLTNGLLTLGNRNLLLGSAAIIAGTPTATNMVVATDSGELRKAFSTPTNFTYPVGNKTGTEKYYSPVTLSFTSGTFATGNYVGVNLVDAKYSNDSITGNYLTRYWTLSQSGITGFNCNATFKYLPADVTGAEGSIYCTKVNPSPWVAYNIANTGTHELTANGISSFSTFSGTGGGMDISLTAFLEGPYNAGAMNTTLNAGGLIPLSQPYNTVPWNYAGPESVTSIPAGVVDWVLIELRQAGAPANATSATILKKRAAFIKSDGTIVDKDGISPIRFYNTALTTNLYPVVRHRNHLAIMANNSVIKAATGNYVYSYSSSIDQIYGTGKKQLGGLWGMIAGDGDRDNTIQNSDFILWSNNFGSDGLYSSDYDLDGTVQNSDFIKWSSNFGLDNSVP